jgi:TRAP-type C4-dicarboxylate transport system permease small subunit
MEAETALLVPFPPPWTTDSVLWPAGRTKGFPEREKMIRFWTFFVNFLNRLTKWVILVAFSVLLILVLMQIVWRYILQWPLPWSDEAIRYLLVWVTLLAIARAFRNDEHLRLGALFSKCARPIQDFLWVSFNLLTLTFQVLLIIYGITNAILGKFTNSPGLDISLFIPYLSVPVAAGIMLINQIDYTLFNFRVRQFGDIRKKREIL